MGKELLTLDALEPDRDFITINGKPYYLRGRGELSISEIARIRRESQAVVDSGINADMSEEDAKKVESFLNDIVGTMILSIGGDLISKLTTLQKFQIVSTFTAVAPSRGAGTKTESQGPPPTTAG